MAAIPGVSNNELVRTTWGNSVAVELNTRCLKIDGIRNSDGTVQVVTAPFIVQANPTMRLRRATSNDPILYFEHTSGTPRYGYVQGLAAGLVLNADAGSQRFLVAGVEVFELAANSAKVTGQGRFGADTAPQLVVADTAAGMACRVDFYGAATNVDTLGTRSGQLGYVGTSALVLQNLLAGITVAAAGAGPIIFDCGSDEVARMSNQVLMVGQTAPDPDNTGTVIFSSGSAGSLRGQTRSTINTAGGVNLYHRHMGTADADNQNYCQFTRTASGTVIGSIQQNGTTGVTYGTTSDYRLKDDLGPVDDPLGLLARLNPRRLAWKDGSGEFDGFLAHEVQDVAGYAVAGAKDATLAPDDEFNPGGIDPQQLDAAKLVPILTAALQAAVARIDELTARIDALEAV
jgi:hypothetical protein